MRIGMGIKQIRILCHVCFARGRHGQWTVLSTKHRTSRLDESGLALMQHMKLNCTAQDSHHVWLMQMHYSQHNGLDGCRSSFY